MAKESMKAREVKRAKTVAKYAEKRKALKKLETMKRYKNFLKTHLRYVCTTVANLQVVPKDICVSLEFLV